MFGLCDRFCFFGDVPLGTLYWGHGVHSFLSRARGTVSRPSRTRRLLPLLPVHLRRLLPSRIPARIGLVRVALGFCSSTATVPQSAQLLSSTASFSLRERGPHSLSMRCVVAVRFRVYWDAAAYIRCAVDVGEISPPPLPATARGLPSVRSSACTRPSRGPRAGLVRVHGAPCLKVDVALLSSADGAEHPSSSPLHISMCCYCPSCARGLPSRNAATSYPSLSPSSQISCARLSMRARRSCSSTGTGRSQRAAVLLPVGGRGRLSFAPSCAFTSASPSPSDARVSGVHAAGGGGVFHSFLHTALFLPAEAPMRAAAVFDACMSSPSSPQFSARGAGRSSMNVAFVLAKRRVRQLWQGQRRVTCALWHLGGVGRAPARARAVDVFRLVGRGAQIVGLSSYILLHGHRGRNRRCPSRASGGTFMRGVQRRRRRLLIARCAGPPVISGACVGVSRHVFPGVGLDCLWCCSRSCRNPSWGAGP
ncbi:hypothetical protein FB451DRAFT_1246636 [Mycena latifolia]|nr:hypothetical protein FB451DRAFT_1246636 [Mycena latifolia]